MLTVASILALAGCSATNVVDPPYDPRGTWVGIWSSEDGSASGALTVEFFLEPTAGGATQAVILEGTGASCSAQGDTGDGSYSSDTGSVSFFVEIRDVGSASAETSGASFTARVNGGRLEGSYATIAFGNCQFCGCGWGPRGTWSAVRGR
jgi:hypothetical protein